MRYYILGLITLIVIIIFWHRCDYKPEKVYIKVPVRYDSIIYRDKQIDSLKKKKETIKYLVPKKPVGIRIDTPKTFTDTVYLGLVNCDSLNKIDSVLIKDLEANNKDLKDINTAKDQIIESKDQEIEGKDQEIKKEKQKHLISKIVAVVALVLTIIISK